MTMAPDLSEAPSPDAVLIAACAAARAAVAAYKASLDKQPDEPDKIIDPLFDQNCLAIERVIMMRASTAQGLAEKALVLVACADQKPEGVNLVMSLANDALALARAMIGVDATRA